MADHDDEPTVGNRPNVARARGAQAEAPLRLTADRYRIGERLGAGGMGEVLAAEDCAIGREIALKRLRAEAPNDQQVQRFVREARIQGRLEHPAIVPVHELGRDVDGRPFFAMKKISGTTLAAILHGAARPGGPRSRLLSALVEVCLAIEYAHVHGIVHRDLKPQNIMLGDFGEVYVLDWGVAKVVGERERDAGFPDLRPEDTVATRAGAVMGTPGYMPPEQADGSGDIDARADIYALGRVLEEVLALEVSPPPELVTVVLRATAADRELRHASARELADTIQRFLDGDRDLMLRERLAGEHLAHAREAFDGGDRSELPMREAGRALALDPRSQAAAELVGRLMLEPPAELPPAVERALERGDVEIRRGAARGGDLADLALLGVAGLLAAAGVYVLAGVLAACAAVLLVGARARRAPVQQGSAVALGVALPIAVLALAYSPLYAAGFAGLAAIVITSRSTGGARETALTAAVLTAAVVAPLVAEPFAVDADGVRLVAPGFAGGGALAWLVLATFGPIVVGLATAMAIRIRRSERTLRRSLELIRWRLAQLAPSSIAGGRGRA